MRPASGPSVLDQLTPDDFVGAVMRSHDRICSNIRALELGAVLPPAAESFDEADDASIISVYCQHRGVEADRRVRQRRADLRRLAV